MFIKILIIGMIFAGCPSKKNQRKIDNKEPTPWPSPSLTDNGNLGGTGGTGGTTGTTVGATGSTGSRRATRATGSRRATRATGATGGGHLVRGVGANVANEKKNELSPNDYIKTDENPSQTPTEENDASQSPITEKAEKSPEQPDQQKSGKQPTKQTTASNPTPDTDTSNQRLPSPEIRLSFIEQEEHLVPVLELKDATAINDLEITRAAHDVAIDSDSFNEEVTAFPKQTYHIKLKLQDRQCSKEIEIKDLSTPKTFQMSCL